MKSVEVPSGFEPPRGGFADRSTLHTGAVLRSDSAAVRQASDTVGKRERVASERNWSGARLVASFTLIAGVVLPSCAYCLAPFQPKFKRLDPAKRQRFCSLRCAGKARGGRA